MQIEFQRNEKGTVIISYGNLSELSDTQQIVIPAGLASMAKLVPENEKRQVVSVEIPGYKAIPVNIFTDTVSVYNAETGASFNANPGTGVTAFALALADAIFHKAAATALPTPADILDAEGIEFVDVLGLIAGDGLTPGKWYRIFHVNGNMGLLARADMFARARTENAFYPEAIGQFNVPDYQLNGEYKEAIVIASGVGQWFGSLNDDATVLSFPDGTLANTPGGPRLRTPIGVLHPMFGVYTGDFNGSADDTINRVVIFNGAHYVVGGAASNNEIPPTNPHFIRLTEDNSISAEDEQLGYVQEYDPLLIQLDKNDARIYRRIDRRGNEVWGAQGIENFGWGNDKVFNNYVRYSVINNLNSYAGELSYCRVENQSSIQVEAAKATSILRRVIVEQNSTLDAHDNAGMVQDVRVTNAQVQPVYLESDGDSLEGYIFDGRPLVYEAIFYAESGLANVQHEVVRNTFGVPFDFEIDADGIHVKVPAGNTFVFVKARVTLNLFSDDLASPMFYQAKAYDNEVTVAVYGSASLNTPYTGYYGIDLNAPCYIKIEMGGIYTV